MVNGSSSTRWQIRPVLKIKQAFDIEISKSIEDVVDELDEEYIVLE